MHPGGRGSGTPAVVGWGGRCGPESGERWRWGVGGGEAGSVQSWLPPLPQRSSAWTDFSERRTWLLNSPRWTGWQGGNLPATKQSGREGADAPQVRRGRAARLMRDAEPRGNSRIKTGAWGSLKHTET